MTAEQVRYGRTGAFVGDVGELDPGRDGEIFAGHVAHRADPGGAIIDLAWVRLGIGDQFRNGMHRERRMDHERAWRRSDSADRRKIRAHVVAHIGKQ